MIAVAIINATVPEETIVVVEKTIVVPEETIVVAGKTIVVPERKIAVVTGPEAKAEWRSS